jgi:hypothetical protein
MVKTSRRSSEVFAAAGLGLSMSYWKSVAAVQVRRNVSAAERTSLPGKTEGVMWTAEHVQPYKILKVACDSISNSAQNWVLTVDFVDRHLAGKYKSVIIKSWQLSEDLRKEMPVASLERLNATTKERSYTQEPQPGGAVARQEKKTPTGALG